MESEVRIDSGLAAEPALLEAEFASAHFRILAPVHSFAASRLSPIATRLEEAYAKLVAGLELKAPLEAITVILSERGDRSEARLAGPPWELYLVYTADAPAPRLEHLLAGLLLTAETGVSRPYPAFVLDAVVGWFLDPDAPDLPVRLAQRRRSGEEIAIGEHLDGPRAKSDGLYFEVAAAFTGFLLQRYGPNAVRLFLSQFDPGVPNRAAESAFGRPVPVVEQEWLATLQQIKFPEPGIRGFFSLAAWHLRQHWPQVALLLTAVLFTLADPIIRPLLFRSILDRAIVPKDTALLVSLVVGLVGLLIFQAAATLLKEYVAALLSARVAADQPVRLFRQLQRLSMQYFQGARANEVAGKLGADLDDMEKGLSLVLVQGASLVLSIVISIAVLIWVNWILALISLACLGLIYVGPFFLNPTVEGAKSSKNKAIRAADRHMIEHLTAQNLVRSLGLESLAELKYSRLVGEISRNTLRSGLWKGILGGAISLSGAAVQVTVFVTGAFMAVSGHLSVGSLYLFNSLFGRNVIAAVQETARMSKPLRDAAKAMQALKELMAESVGVAERPDARPVELPLLELVLQSVSFSYTGDVLNLRDISCRLPGRGMVAVVGPSGSGKSTLVNLLLRLYDPSTGSIRLNQADLRSLQLDSIRANVAAVLQDALLFNATIAENIRIGKPGCSDAEVERAARLAGIHDFATSLPQGYETPVGERGSRLSRGQRQRVALARALVREPTVLILDEATSALDPETEQVINGTLRQLSQDRLVLMVTHRLWSAVGADRILVLDRGRLTEEGTHPELLEAGGMYHRLWTHQQGLADGRVEPGHPVAGMLQEITLFRGVDERTLGWLSTRFVTEQFEPGANVFMQGDPGDKFYIVVTGTLDVLLPLPSGSERRLATLQDGDYFGEMALIQDVLRTATVRARVLTKVLTLDQGSFNQMLYQEPNLRTAIEEVSAARRRENESTQASQQSASA